MKLLLTTLIQIKTMKQKIKKLCELIDGELSHITNLISFKIGKASDLEERETQYYFDGFNDFNEIANGKPATINVAEIELIRYFMNESKYKDKCLNINEGGGPSEKANHLYIAIKYGAENIDELYDYIFISSELPISLD